jgi:hypothetical protein
MNSVMIPTTVPQGGGLGGGEVDRRAGEGRAAEAEDGVDEEFAPLLLLLLPSAAISVPSATTTP